MIGAWVVAALVAAAPARALDEIALRASGGRATTVADAIASHRFAVVVFHSARCPSFAAHATRIVTLARELGTRDVAVLIVDSERHEPDEAIVRELARGVPVWRDEGGRLARLVGAAFATESFVFDRAGTVVYRGGFDSERTRGAGAPEPYLADAMASLLAGGAPKTARTKALGCVLRLR